ncbi:MAG: 30S ribosomal protein S16 [Bryobacterales bacterium]|nr:30S ribosomal protein S16 [Bryobacterales bacterium]
MVTIRLARFGAKKRPTYRVVVIDSRNPRDGKAIEVVGSYNPVAQPVELNLNQERIEHWVRNGAQLSDTVKRLVQKSTAEAPAATA